MAPMNSWCRSVTKTSVTPNSPKKALTLAVGWACSGLVVWAKDKVVCSETISPATDSAPRNMRSSAPRPRPTASSMAMWPTRAARVSGTGGRVARTIGYITMASTRARARRMRAGTAASPIPGSSMTRAPTRVNTSPTPNTWAARA